MITFASDAVMDVVEAIRAKPEGQRTDEERWRLHYAEAHGFTRTPKLPPADDKIWTRK